MKSLPATLSRMGIKYLYGPRYEMKTSQNTNWETQADEIKCSIRIIIFRLHGGSSKLWIVLPQQLAYHFQEEKYNNFI